MLNCFRNGDKLEYSGGRTKDSIVSWMKKKSGPPSVEVDCDTLKTKLEDAKFSLVFFGDEADALFTAAHIPLATKNDKVSFFNVKDAACATQYGVTGPKEVFFRKFEQTQINYDGAADLDSLQEFVKPLMVPTVFEFTEEEIEPIFGQQQPSLFLFRSGDDKDAEFMKTYEEAAKANKGKMLFAYSDIADGI